MAPLCAALGADGAMLPLAVRYGRVLSLALVPFILQNMFQSFLVAAERPKLGLWLTVAAGVTNMAGDYLLVGVLPWGVTGAAIAFLRTLLFQAAAIFVLPVFLELDGIWLAVTAAEALTLAVTGFLMVSRRKRYGYGG